MRMGFPGSNPLSPSFSGDTSHSLAVWATGLHVPDVPTTLEGATAQTEDRILKRIGALGRYSL